MGASNSITIQNELLRPIDASDVTTLESAKAEICRLRSLLPCPPHAKRKIFMNELGEAIKEAHSADRWPLFIDHAGRLDSYFNHRL